MLRFAMDGIVGFSVVPLRAVMGLGVIASLLAILGTAYALALRTFTNMQIASGTALLLGVLFMGGVQLVSVGIVGEYVGRSYEQSKRRPLYFIRDRMGFEDAATSLRERRDSLPRREFGARGATLGGEGAGARHSMTPRVAIIGGGFAGLAAAWELTRRGVTPIVLEADNAVGGLAGSFEVNGERLERFYHHWFTSDTHVAELARELGTESRIVYRATRTGLYFANHVFRLSSPLDVLRFTPLSLVARLRLGLLALRARARQELARSRGAHGRGVAGAAGWPRGVRCRVATIARGEVRTVCPRRVGRVVLEQAQAARRKPEQGRRRESRILSRRLRCLGGAAGRMPFAMRAARCARASRCASCS